MQRIAFLALFVISLTSVAIAQELQPRFETLLQSLDGQPDRPCPRMNTRYGLTDMVPAIAFRKDPTSDTDFTVLRYYPMYGLITLSVRTSGKRFANQCKEAAVSLVVKDGAIDSGAFIKCPGRESDDMLELYGVDQDKKLVGENLKPIWQQRADEFITEIESIVALCK